MNTTVNQIAVGLFLVFNLAIGLYASKGIRTMRDYAVANKSLGTGVLMATLMATLIGTGSLGLKRSYLEGFISLVDPLTFILLCLFIGGLILPSLAHCTQELTVADVMYKFYGIWGLIFTVVTTTIFSLLTIAGQLVLISKTCLFFGINDPRSFIVLFGLLITVYTVTGGLRAVATTDVFQLLVVVIGIVSFFLLALQQLSKEVGSISKIVKNIAQNPKAMEHLRFFRNKNFRHALLMASFWSFPSMMVAPPIVQRCLATKKARNIKTMFFTFIVAYCFLRMLIALISLGQFSTTGTHTLYNNAPLMTFIETVCHNPLAQLALVLSISAVVMSKSDSYLNSLAILWTHNVLKPLQKKYTKNKSFNTLKWVRISTLSLGIMITMLGLVFYEISFFQLIGSAHMALSCLVIPFLLGLMGLKKSPKAFLASIASFVGGMMILKLAHAYKVSGITSLVDYITEQQLMPGPGFVDKTFHHIRSLWFLALPTSTVVFLVAHYLEHGAFVFVDREKHIWKDKKRYKVSDFFQWLAKPIAWCNQKAQQGIVRPTALSIFTIAYCLCLYLTPIYNTDVFVMIGVLRLGAIILALLVMAKENWNQALQPYFNWAYYATILYTYVFLPVVTLIADPTNPFMVFHLVIGLLVLGMLVDWSAFLLYAMIGTLLGLVTNRLWLTYVWIPAFSTNQGLLITGGVLAAIGIVAAFMREAHKLLYQYRQEVQYLTEERKETILTYEDSHEQVHATLHKNSSMMQAVQKVVTQLQQEGTDTAHIQTIEAAMGHFYAIAQRAKDFLYIQPKPIVLASLLDQVCHALARKGIDPAEKVRMYTHKAPNKVTGDVKHLGLLMVNAIAYAQAERPNSLYHIHIEKAWLDYELPAIYKSKAEAAYCITITTAEHHAAGTTAQYYKPYASSKKTLTLHHIGLLQNRRITHAHYGHFDLQQGKHITQTYVLPVHLSTIRPKISKFASEDLAHVTQITSAADQAFLDKVKAKGLKHKKIELALKVAKHCHQDQVRKSGEAFYLHPLAVATLVLDQWEALIQQFNFTKAQITDLCIAALLHDTIEDTTFTAEQMIAMFGTEVTRIVKEVTHLYRKAVRPKMKLGKSKTLDALITGGNLKSLLIKLLDRVHNMRTIYGQPPHKQKRIAQETQDIFVPIAEKLDLENVVKELKKWIATVLA